MPQYQQQKKGQARVRIVTKDATRAYLLIMKHNNTRLQAMPNEVYVIEDRMLPILTENHIEFEILDQK